MTRVSWYRVPAACVALLLCVVPLPARSSLFPVAELQRGQVGEGVTRMEGGERVSFRAHILGVLDGVIGPKRQVILARLEGAGLEDTGVIAGMSGSPVYIDGRLVGAIAYSIGMFPKVPIAGITPIAEMLDAAAVGSTDAPRTVSTLPLDTPLTSEALLTAFRSSLARWGGAPVHVSTLAGLGVDSGASAPMLRPIATPLTMAGVGGEMAQWVGEAFAGAGFVPVSGGALPAGRQASGPLGERSLPTDLAPGDAVGVRLVGGDLSLGATGTVTSVDGSRVLAFGHPFFNLGPVHLPMTRADVVAVVPSLLYSVKLASLGEVLGVMDQDRATAIGGTLGGHARTIPLSVSMQANGGAARTFSFEVAEDQLLTPLLTFVSVANVLQSYQRELGVSTIRLTGSARVGEATLRLDDVFTGDRAVFTAAASLAAPLSAVLRSDLGRPQIGPITLTMQTDERQRTTRLDQVWLANPRARAGETVSLQVRTRSFREAPQTHHVSIPIPAHASGPLQVQIIDGATLAALEGRRRSIEQARSVEELVSLLNDARRGDRWYVRLTRPAAGTVVSGRDLPALPGTVLTVLNGASSPSTTLDQDVLGEWEIPADAVATGQRTLTLTPLVP